MPGSGYSEGSITKTKILSGPSKFELMLAIFDKVSLRPPLLFKTTENKAMEIIVSGIKRKNYSAETWLVEGNFFPLGVPKEWEDVDFRKSMWVKFTFDTRTRKGEMTIHEDIYEP